MVWHAAHLVLNAYSPGSKSIFGASAYERVGLAAVCQLFKQLPIVVARNLALSRLELRIHCPVASLPISRCGVCPSGPAAGSEYRPSFLLISSISDFLPVRKSQPGPVWNFSA